MTNIWALVLAAGESVRMKRPKMLLPFNGKTIIECALENISHSGIEHISVVLGAASEEIISLIETWPVQYCYNEKYKQGMLSSVICGIRSIPPEAEAIMIFPGDQPMIPPEAIRAVAGAFRKSDKGLVIPIFKGRRGHPLLIHPGYRGEIGKLAPEEGLRALAGKFPSDVLEVDLPFEGVLKDMDTPEDYQRIYSEKEIGKTGN